MSNIKRIGVYAGSFNPFHVGHADILHQSQEVFDEVIIAIGQNPEKERSSVKFPYRHPILRDAKVMVYEGLLSDFLNYLSFNHDDCEYFLIRGLRNGADLQYEQNQLRFIKEMFPSLKTVIFIGDSKFDHISSSALRALEKVSEKEYRKYVFTALAVPDGPKFGTPSIAVGGWGTNA